MAFTHSVSVPIIVIEDTLTENVYIEFLKTKVIPFLRSKGILRTCIFMQDGERPHIIKKSLAFIESQFAGGFLSD